MGWWSLGPEDAEDAIDHPFAESPPPLPVRRARGGAGRVPAGRKHKETENSRKPRSRSPRKTKRTKSPKKKRARVVGGPLDKAEEELNLFASIGRMMTNNNARYATSDLSTLGTAKYPGQDGIPVEAFNNTNEAQRRANEMANAMAWLTNPNAAIAQESSSNTGISENWWENEEVSTSSSALELLKAEEMPDLMALLKLGRTSSDDNSVNPAATVGDETRKYYKVSAEEKKAVELQKSIEWLQNNHTKYVHEDDLEYDEESFEKVDDGFGQVELKKTPSIKWEKYIPMENRKQTKKLAKSLKESLDRFLTDDFDAESSPHDRIVLKQLKDLLADWKLREDDGTKELEEALSYWKLHASDYDPVTATDEETDRFLEHKRLLAMLGWKEDDDAWDKRSKEMEEALAVWKSHQDESLENLDDVAIEQIKKVDDILVQVSRDGLTDHDMKYMAKEMEKILTGYIEKGYKITDLSKVEMSYQPDFEKAQSLLSLCVKRAEILPDQLLGDIVEMLKSLGQNDHRREIVEKYEGEMARRFQKLQEALVNWKADGIRDTPGATEGATDEAVYTTIERALNWWVEEGENFDRQNASEEEVNKAEFAKNILNIWIPADSAASSRFHSRSSAVEEIKDGLALCRVMEEPEQLPFLATPIEMKRRQTDPPALSWMRKTTTDDSAEGSESLDIENPTTLFLGVIPAALSEEEKRAEEMSSALAWLRNGDAELDVDDDISVALSIATFKKIDILMPKTKDSNVPTTMTGALEWLRSRTEVDDDTVSSFKKIDDVLTRSGASATIKEGGFTGALEWLRKRHERKTVSDVESTSNNSHIEHAEIFSNQMSDVGRRTEQMHSALDWLRSADAGGDVSIDSDDGSVEIRSNSNRMVLDVPHSDDRTFVLEDELDGARVRAKMNEDTQNDDTPEAVVEDHAVCSPSLGNELKYSNETFSDVKFCRNVKATSPSTDEPDGNSELKRIEMFTPVSTRSKTEGDADSAGTEYSWRRNTLQNDCPDDTGMTLIGDELVKPVSSSEGKSVPQTDAAMDWSRSNAVSDSVVKTSQTQPDSTSRGRDPKQRSKDLEAVVQWMRKGQGRGLKKEDKYDPTGDFRRLQSLLPHVPGQDKAARAQIIEGALDWYRGRNNHLMDSDIKSKEVFEKSDVIAVANQRIETSTKDAPREISADWRRFADGSTEIASETGDDKAPFKRACDVDCIPRPHSPTGVHDDDLAWRMHVGRLIPGVPNENVSCEDHVLLNFIPHAPEGGQEIQNDHLNWVRHPWVEALSDEETLCFDHPRNFRSIPREGLPSDDSTEGSQDWQRSNDVQNSEVNGLPFKVTSMINVLPIAANRDSPAAHLNLVWARHAGSPADIHQENVSPKRLGDINSIPRDGVLSQTVHPAMTWSRHENELVPRISEREHPSNSPGMLNCIPTSREEGEGLGDDNVDWIHQPGVGTRLDEAVLTCDRPGEIRSIPRDGLPKSEVELDTELTRHPNKSTPGVADDTIPFERQGLLDAVPRSSDLNDESSEDNLDRTRNRSLVESSFPAKEMLLTTPGEVRSIPRFSEEKPEDNSEFMRARDVSKSKNKLSAPDEDILSAKPEDLRSIARCGEEKPSIDSEILWARDVSESTTESSVPNKDIRSTRPADIESIPRVGEEKPEDESKLMWARGASKPENKTRAPDEVMQSAKPGIVGSIPRSGEQNLEENPEFVMKRYAAEEECEKVEPLERPPTSNSVLRSKQPAEESDEEGALGRLSELTSIPRTGKPKTSEDVDLEWARCGGKFIPGVPEDDDVFIRPIVRDSTLDGVAPYDETNNIGEWSRHTCSRSYTLTPGEDNVFDRPRDIRSVPRVGKPHEEAYPSLGWNRNPAWNNRLAASEENVFDRPSDIRSIPRDGKQHEEAYLTLGWSRSTAWKKQSLSDDAYVFDRPGDLRSIPRPFRQHDQDHPRVSWGRNIALKPEEQFDEDDVFDRPGNLRSIPRDGHVRDESSPEMTWGRNLGSKQQRSPEEQNVFDRPGDIRSIPRDGRLKDSHDPAFEWERRVAFDRAPRDAEEVNVYDRQGDLRSIPHDGRSTEIGEPKLHWRRHFSSKSVSVIPVDVRAPPRDGMHPGEEQQYEEKPEYDWSGSRPHHIRSIAPYVDWSSDKAEDARYDWMGTSPDGALASKKEPNFDWSGARPFDRPTEDTLATLPVTSLDDDEVSSYCTCTVPDSITVFTELREEKPRPVTGVPCVAWTMLALGAAAGGAMGSATTGNGGAVTSSFAANNGVGSSTDMVYPEAGSLPNCASDANCQIVMDGLSPVLPPNVLGLFDMPGTCQTKARDWLRTGKDILEFKAERIRQRYAMSVFFCEMDGGDWVEGDSWLSDLHECDWYNKVGLDPCNRHEQMEMLRVTDNGLAGTLPVEMFILSNLYEFTLANNLISGSLPQLFDKFKELDTLVIPFNQFEGSFPHQIWEYPDMVYLDVAYNGFTGTIPVDIDTRMPNLQVAYLENNKLSGPIPEAMGNLEKLRKLHLDDNKFTGSIPSTLGLPPRLSELLLHDNLLTGQVPKQLGDLNRLQLLTLHYNSLGEQTMDEHICNLVYNEQLELATVDKAIIDCGCCSAGEASFV